MKASPPKLVTIKSENWHVKRDEKPSIKPDDEKKNIDKSSLEQANIPEKDFYA